MVNVKLRKRKVKRLKKPIKKITKKFKWINRLKSLHLNYTRNVDKKAIDINSNSDYARYRCKSKNIE